MIPIFTPEIVCLADFLKGAFEDMQPLAVLVLH
jgi:hypothetical protein